MRSVVAQIDGRIVGHTGITVVHQGSLVCETGNTVVDPEMRGRGLLKLLGGGLRERVLRDGFIGYVHYPTTAHEIMQRSSVSGSGVETGLMLAYVPDTTVYTAVETRSGRIAVTVVYQPFIAAPARAVYVPARYADLLRSIYAKSDLQRSFRSGAPQWDAASDLLVSSKPDRGLLNVLVTSAAADLADVVRTHVDRSPAAVVHVDLPMTAAWLDAGVEALIGAGCFFCALLPEFERCDLLRMQFLRRPLSEDFAPDVINADAKGLLKLIRHEAGLI